MSKVFINDRGGYLVFNQVSSHSPNVTYGFLWTQNLNQASIARDAKYLSKLNWKEHSPVDQIVAEIDVEEVRVVTMRRPA